VQENMVLKWKLHTNIFTQQFVSTHINKSPHLNPTLHQEALRTSSAKCAKCQVVY